ncbi:hypothetical protein BDR26DRAFT_872113 [Obelidium mucronatum]|nr:hypothetical protein BDR26DRAFT_872113 [Obelidium mucronatum]
MNKLLTTATAAAIRPSLQPFGGNGLLASRRIRKGELLFGEAPLLSVLKTKQETGKRCSECWRTTDSPSGFCAKHNASLLQKSRSRLLTQPGFDGLRAAQAQRLSESNGKEGAFSLMITDLVGLSLVDLLSTGSMNNSANLMESLVRGKDMPLEGTPKEWIRDYEEMKQVLLKGQGLADLFSLKWYTDQMTRLNLNSMQTNFLASASAAPVVGTSLYLYASMMNHSCRPNVMIDWVDSNEIQVFAKTDIEEGDEVLMSYVGEVEATEDPVVLKERWEFFRFNYGFICKCPLCSISNK